MKHVVIISALEREVQALIVSHRKDAATLPGTSLRCYTHENAWIVCGGIGPQAARAAAQAVVSARRPDLLVSVGFAGALHPGLRSGDLVEPAIVIAADTGKSYPTRSGVGALISASHIADAAYKSELHAKFNGKAVDMEAAAVADVAAQNGIAFIALKAISDEAHVTLPDLTAFIDARGNFKLGGFLRHIAIRPFLWPGIGRLARNGGRASATLHKNLSERFASGEFQRLAAEDKNIGSK